MGAVIESALVLTSLGWLIGGMGFLYQRHLTKRDAEHRRQQRILRTLQALEAELEIGRKWQARFFGPEVYQSNLDRFLDILRTAEEFGDPSMPSGAVGAGNIVFDTVRDELADLPSDVLKPLIDYYQSAEAVAETMKAFYEGRYETLRMVRREAAITGFFRTGADALQKAIRAYEAVTEAENNQISKMEDMGVEYREPKRLAIDRPDQAPSDDDDGGPRAHDLISSGVKDRVE